MEPAVSLSSYARDSVSDLTAALVALYDGLPLHKRGVKTWTRKARSRAYGGFVIPCFDPVLMITAGFSWCSMFGTNVCCTFRTLNPRAGGRTAKSVSDRLFAGDGASGEG